MRSTRRWFQNPLSRPVACLLLSIRAIEQDRGYNVHQPLLPLQISSKVAHTSLALLSLFRHFRQIKLPSRCFGILESQARHFTHCNSSASYAFMPKSSSPAHRPTLRHTTSVHPALRLVVVPLTTRTITTSDTMPPKAAKEKAVKGDEGECKFRGVILISHD